VVRVHPELLRQPRLSQGLHDLNSSGRSDTAHRLGNPSIEPERTIKIFSTYPGRAAKATLARLTIRKSTGNSLSRIFRKRKIGTDIRTATRPALAPPAPASHRGMWCPRTTRERTLDHCLHRLDASRISSCLIPESDAKARAGIANRSASCRNRGHR